MKKKGIFWWLIFSILCVWQFPQLLVALTMLPFMKDRKLVADRHFNLCFRSPSMNGGISLGPIAYVSERSGEETIAHETDGHTVDSKIFGPFYLLVIGLPSIIWASQYEWGDGRCYYDFYTERRANRFAGLEADKNCRLHFIKKEA